MSYITGRAINAQVGTSYTVLDSDRDRLVTYNNSAAVAVTLPQASTPAGQFGPGWTSYHQNIGTGVVTITPTTSTINGETAITLFQWETATITSDGTNYKAFLQPLASTDPESAVSAYLQNDAGVGAARNQLIVRNINSGVNSQRKGFNIYLEHDGAAGASNYDGLQVNFGFTADGLTPKTQGQSDGIEVLAYGAVAQATFTSVANASAGSTVYTGTVQNGANNGLAGLTYTVAGFTNGANNGVFTCTASTSTTMTLNNAAGVAETHAATATPLTTFTLTSVANASGGSTVYTGTIPNGGSNFYSGWNFRIFGFTTAANNGFFPCTASTTTTLTLTNASGVAETHAANAVWYLIGQINAAKLRWGSSQSANVQNNLGLLQYLPSIQPNSNLENFTGFSIDAPAGGGNIWNFTGVAAGTNLNSMANVNVEIGLSASAFSTPSVTAVAILATGKTAGIVNNDSTVASSFIGHGNTTTLALHDGWYGFTGSPEGAVTAAVGSMYSQQNGAQNTAFWIKTTGSGNTGWSTVMTAPPSFTPINLTAQGANIAATTLYSVGASGAGLYEVSIYTVVSRAATTSSTLPDTQIIFTDQDSNATITINATAGNSGNTTSTFEQATFVVNAKASTTIQYATGQITPFASVGGTSMQYAYRARVRFLG